MTEATNVSRKRQPVESKTEKKKKSQFKETKIIAQHYMYKHGVDGPPSIRNSTPSPFSGFPITLPKPQALKIRRHHPLRIM